VLKDLKSEYGDKFSFPHYFWLWSRMVSSGLHDDMDSPQKFQYFVVVPKKPVRRHWLMLYLKHCPEAKSQIDRICMKMVY